MTQMTIKRLIALTSMVFVIIISYIIIYKHYGSESTHIKLETFQLKDGWGYKIVMNKKTLIYQPTIPAIDSSKPFPSEESARKVGDVVRKRIIGHKDFAITTNDLVQFGII